MRRSLTSKALKSASVKTSARAKRPTPSGPAAASRRSLRKIKAPTVNRKLQALKRLGVDAGELARAPEITPVLKQAEGGLPAVLAALRFSNDLSAQHFVEKYDAVPVGDRAKLSWEAICLATEVDPSHLLGAAILALQTHSANTVRIIAVTNHPKLVRKRVEYAMLPGGDRDRNALDTAVGFLPSPKGPTFITQVRVDNNKAGPDDEDDDGPDLPVDDQREGDLNHLFPPVARMQEIIQPIRQKALPTKSRG